MAGESTYFVLFSSRGRSTRQRLEGHIEEQDISMKIITSWMMMMMVILMLDERVTRGSKAVIRVTQPAFYASEIIPFSQNTKFHLGDGGLRK
jgi:hypothetical protein